MTAKSSKRLMREGDLVAEVDVQLLEAEGGWAPYLSLEDAYRLDDVRDALRAGDVKTYGTPMTKVTVYYFKKHNVVTDKSVRSQRPATLETIAKCRGEVIEETAMEVETARLDGEGFLAKED